MLERTRFASDYPFGRIATDYIARKVELIDFGASQEYSSRFIEQFGALLLAAIEKNEATCIQRSQDIGYLTGEENQVVCCAIPVSGN